MNWFRGTLFRSGRRTIFGGATPPNPVRLILLGYAIYMGIGWGLLSLPFSRREDGSNALDHLFTSVSAVSTTGLATVATGETYTWFGQTVVLVLIQLGGLGYMTISSFVVLTFTGGLPVGRKRIAELATTTPQPWMVRRYLRLIVAFTAVMELLGALALYPIFLSHGAPQPAWQAVFHSVSAFCTAGFGLMSNSFEDYRTDWGLAAVISVLSYSGALGFIVVNDAWHSLVNRRRTVTLTTKIILWCTLWIGAGAAILLYLDEPALRALPPGERVLAAIFQAMTASTTVGFNTVPISTLSASSLFMLTLVMIVGASPSGTGGGLKTTTITALWAEMVSVIRRRETTEFARRTIPEHRMRAAVASATFYAFTLAAGIYLLALVETEPWPDQMFECASALGTVGLSRGMTGTLSPAGKVIIIALMYLGRVGPISMGMSLVRGRTAGWRYVDEDVVI